jgi:hypothetical protein
MKLSQLVEAMGNVHVGETYVTSKYMSARHEWGDRLYIPPGYEFKVIEELPGWPMMKIEITAVGNEIDALAGEYALEPGTQLNAGPLIIAKQFKGTKAEFNRKFLDDLHESVQLKPGQVWVLGTHYNLAHEKNGQRYQTMFVDGVHVTIKRIAGGIVYLDDANMPGLEFECPESEFLDVFITPDEYNRRFLDDLHDE